MPYTDQTYGQTFDFSNDYSSQGADRLFDNDTGLEWYIDNPLSEEWVEVEFDSAQDIVKLRLRSVNFNAANYCPEAFRFKASNTGAFGGEEVTLLDISGLSWVNNEWKEWEFSNGTAYKYYRLYMDRNSSSWMQFSESEWMTYVDIEGDVADEFGIDDVAGAIGGAYIDLISDELGIADLVEGQGGSQEVQSQDELGIDDQVIATGDSQAETFADQIGLNDFLDGYLMTDHAPGSFGIADNIEGGYEFNTPSADELGIDDLTNAINWSEFLRLNSQKFVIAFYCTLTGLNDGLSDVELKMQSFQARKRTGEATYVSAVIPGVESLQDILDRPNGQIIIEMTYLIGGQESLREEILRVDFENTRYDKGTLNRSVTISGHRTETFGINEVDLEDPNYKYLSEGKLRYRFPIIDPWLNPGDTCRVQSEGDEFRVDYITYVVSSTLKFMEVSEV